MEHDDGKLKTKLYLNFANAIPPKPVNSEAFAGLKCLICCNGCMLANVQDKDITVPIPENIPSASSRCLLLGLIDASASALTVLKFLSENLIKSLDLNQRPLED